MLFSLKHVFKNLPIWAAALVAGAWRPRMRSLLRAWGFGPRRQDYLVWTVRFSPRVRSLRRSTRSLQSATPVDFVFLVLVAFHVSVFGIIAESFYVVAGRCVFSQNRHLSTNKHNSFADALEWLAEFKVPRVCCCLMHLLSLGFSICRQVTGAYRSLFGLTERTTICCSQDDRASVYRELAGQAAQRRLDIESVVSAIGIFVSSTRNIIFLDHMKKLEIVAFVGSTEHFDNEIYFAESRYIKLSCWLKACKNDVYLLSEKITFSHSVRGSPSLLRTGSS